MSDTILIGRGNQILAVPQATWKQHLSQLPKHSRDRLNFMTGTYHRIRNFVVRELANRQKPLEPEFIAERLKIPLEQVNSILDELERKLFFLVRNEQGSVAWAYPVTVETTPHRLYFSTGERLYGA